MAVPTITLPVPIEQIPAEIRRLSDHIRTLRLEMEISSKLIQAVRECCPHEKTTSGNTWGRDSWTRCNHCGKEW